jgi:fibronectin-binding autotransporter adhesin
MKMRVNRIGRTCEFQPSRSRRILMTAVAAVPLAASGIAWGIPNRYDYYTGTGTQDFSLATGWSDGAPSSEDAARVASSGTLNVTTPSVVNSLTFGYGDNFTPTLNISAGGSLTSGNDIIFGGTGAAAGSNGVLATLNQNGGSLLIPSNHILWMGFGGSAVYNMSGGTTTVGYPGFSSLGNLGVSIGTGAGTVGTPTGTLNMTAGTINSDAVFEIARNGSNGVLNLSGGVINVGTEVWIGQPGSTGGLATITQTAGTINTGYNQYGVNSYGNFLMGVGNPGKAANYTLSGTGAVNVYRHMYVGGAVSTLTGGTGGEGNFIMNGGTVSIGDARQVSGSSLYIGWSPTTTDSKGTVTVNSGTMTFNLPRAEIVAGSYQSNAGTLPIGQTGTLTIAGGQVLNPKGTLEIGRAGATGAVNLSAGQLSINSLTWLNPNANVRTFNWTGGTLDANAASSDYAITNAGGTFRPGGTAAQVFTTTGTDGSYVQNSGTLTLDATSSSTYDALDLSAGGIGAANLAGGNVSVVASGGFAPAFGVSIPAITAKTISDSATWTLPTLPAGEIWDKRISTDGANQVETLTVVRSSASTLSSGSSWTAATWSSGTPNGVDASATLAGVGGTITIDSPVTVGYLQLDGSSGWTVGGASTLTVATTGGATGGIVAFGGAHTISAPVQFSTNAAIGTQLKSTSVTLSGNISGTATVEKTGPGSLTLGSATSPFTGTWSISGGALNIASDANLGAAAAKLALSNTTLNVTSGMNSARTIALAGSNTLNAGGDSTLSGVISGAGGITKADSNTLTLSAANTYAGATNVNAGVLHQGVANAVPASSALTLSTGTTFDLGGFAASVGSIAGSGNITTGGANLTAGNDNSSTTFSGLVSGGGTFTKNGTGTLVFNRPASAAPAASVVPIDGNIVVNGGTLQFNALNQTTYDLPPNDITVNAGGNISLNTTGAAGPNGGAFFNSIHGAGTVTIGASYLVLLTAPSDYTGGTIITGGSTASISDLGALGASGTPIQFKGSGTRDNSYAGGLWFEIGDHVTPTGGTFSHPISIDGFKLAILSARGNDITLDQPITGDGGIQYSGGGFGGTFRMNAVSTYKGVSQIDAGVSVILGANNALPANATAVNGSLDLNGHPVTLGYLVSAGTPTINLNGANLTLAGDIEQQFGGAWTGTISGNGSVIKSGGYMQVFSLPAGSASTYTGPTTIHQGSLLIANNVNGLPIGGNVTIDQGGELIFGTTAAASGLAAGTPVTYSGNISGAGEVEISSTEKVVLSGTNTYTGGTRISNGYMLVSADANLGAPTAPITFYWNGANPGPILQYAAGFTSARNVVLQNSPSFVDTNGFDASLGNVDGNVDPRFPLGSFSKIFGAGKLTVNHVRLNALTVNAGTLAIAPNAGANSVSNVKSLSIGGGAKLDLSDNNMVVGGNSVGTWNGAAYTGVTGYIASGRNGGGWGGTTGIVTSQTQAIAGNLTTIGVATASQVKGIAATTTSIWSGQTVTGSDTLVMYTYGGDANLDGKINVDDYTRIDFNVPLGASGWYNGDFNYDGKINVDDYTIIDFNVGIQGAVFPTGSGAGGLSGVSAVPEPASLSIIGLAAASLMGRRCRRK